VTLAGLPEGVFYGLLAGTGAVVTLLYLLKLRRRRVLVPFTPLWARVLEQREATSLLKRLKRLFSWLVQMVFAVLLVFALADPRPAEESREVRFTAILVDASASMMATDVTPSRLARAQEEARSVIRGLGSEEQAMVVEVGAQATPLGPFTKDKDVLLAAVDRVRAADSPADLGRALATVTASLRGRPRPRIVLLSDGKLPETEGVDLSGSRSRGEPWAEAATMWGSPRSTYAATSRRRASTRPSSRSATTPTAPSPAR
jgi:hypothetical protein